MPHKKDVRLIWIKTYLTAKVTRRFSFGPYSYSTNNRAKNNTYFNSKTLKSISNMERDFTTSKIPFCHFCPGSVCLKQFSKTIFIFVRPIEIQTIVHFESSQFLVVTFDMGC